MLQSPSHFFLQIYPPPKDPNQKPIPDYVYNEADWKDKVRREYEYMIRAEPNSNNPIRKLIVLKQAIRTVSDEYRNAERGELEEDATPEDKLGLAMTCLGGLEDNRASLVAKCCRLYPQIERLDSGWIHTGRHRSLY